MQNDNQTKRTKFAALLLVLALLCALLTACGAKKDPPTIKAVNGNGEHVELPLVTVLVDNSMAPNFEAFLQTVPGNNWEFIVKCEFLPDAFESPQDREQELQRIRTEILSGKGPDLFVLDSYYESLVEASQSRSGSAVFNFPQQAMENRVFLPLDEYLDNAEVMEWDKLNPTIMAAGRNDQGQLIIPMQFDFNVVPWRPSGYGMDVELPQNRQELLDSGCGVLEFAGMGGQQVSMLNGFVPLVDWDKDAPAFTEEQLLEKVLLERESWQRWTSGRYDFFTEAGELDRSKIDIKEGWTAIMSSRMSNYDYIDDWHFISGISDIRNTNIQEGTVLVPSYNDNDGITAFVTTYAAINANANYPEYAFRVLDKLLSKGEMVRQTLYGWCCGYPVYMGVGSHDTPFQSGRVDVWAYAQFEELMKKVDDVRFLTELDWEARELEMKAVYPDEISEDEIKRAVHDSYMTMKMMLAES